MSHYVFPSISIHSPWMPTLENELMYSKLIFEKNTEVPLPREAIDFYKLLHTESEILKFKPDPYIPQYLQDIPEKHRDFVWNKVTKKFFKSLFYWDGQDVQQMCYSVERTNTWSEVLKQTEDCLYRIQNQFFKSVSTKLFEVWINMTKTFDPEGKYETKTMQSVIDMYIEGKYWGEQNPNAEYWRAVAPIVERYRKCLWLARTESEIIHLFWQDFDKERMKERLNLKAYKRKPGDVAIAHPDGLTVCFNAQDDTGVLVDWNEILRHVVEKCGKDLAFQMTLTKKLNIKHFY